MESLKSEISPFFVTIVQLKIGAKWYAWYPNLIINLERLKKIRFHGKLCIMNCMSFRVYVFKLSHLKLIVILDVIIASGDTTQ